MRLRLPLVYPTNRLVIAFVIGSAWFFAAPWAGQFMLVLGLSYNIALFGLAILDALMLRDAAKCEVTRHCETTLSIGQKNPVWIQAEHDGVLPLRVVARDEPPLEFAMPEPYVVLDLLPGNAQKANYRVQPTERGDYKFGNLNVRFFTKLRLMTRQRTVPCEMMVKVYPDIFQTRKHLILARENRVVQMGLRHSRIRGQGTEFERLRDYVPDDSLRHIDWKATARRNTLTTREYDVEQSQNIMILLDMGRNMASRTVETDGSLGMTKADSAINASVLLAHVASQSDDRVGLFCFAREPIAFVTPAKGKSQASRLLDALYPLQARTEEPNYHDNFLLLTERQKKRSLIFLFTDLIDPDASQRLINSIGLLSRKHLVVCVALADYELPTILESRPKKAADIYAQSVAMSIIGQRKKALAKLSGLGVIGLDATPSDLSISTVNKYLQLKREARL